MPVFNEKACAPENYLIFVDEQRHLQHDLRRESHSLENGGDQ